MAWLSVYREAAGWVLAVAGVIIAVILVRYAQTQVTGRRRPRKRPAPPLASRARCPWCHTHECTDVTKCNCATPCGSWLCVVKEASRG